MTYTQKDYDNINLKIECTQSEIDRNERSQDNFISKFGMENSGLLKKHDALCDEMHQLIQKRHEIAKCLF